MTALKSVSRGIIMGSRSVSMQFNEPIKLNDKMNLKIVYCSSFEKLIIYNPLIRLLAYHGSNYSARRNSGRVLNRIQFINSIWLPKNVGRLLLQPGIEASFHY